MEKDKQTHKRRMVEDDVIARNEFLKCGCDVNCRIFCEKHYNEMYEDLNNITEEELKDEQKKIR